MKTPERFLFIIFSLCISFSAFSNILQSQDIKDLKARIEILEKLGE